MPTRPSDRWYMHPIHRARAKDQLRREPLCAYCLREGHYTSAEVAHHATPHGDDWNEFLTGRLVSLCRRHHNRQAQREEHGSVQQIDVHGWPICELQPEGEYQKMPTCR